MLLLHGAETRLFLRLAMIKFHEDPKLDDFFYSADVKSLNEVFESCNLQGGIVEHLVSRSTLIE